MARRAVVTVEFWSTGGEGSRYTVEVFDGEDMVHSECGTMAEDRGGRMAEREGRAKARAQGCAKDDIEVSGPREVPDPRQPRRR